MVTHCLSQSLGFLSENGKYQIMQPGEDNKKENLNVFPVLSCLYLAILFSFQGQTVHPS